MKLLFYRYGSICEPDLIATFQAFGMETIEYSREIEYKNDNLADSVRRLGDFLQEHPVDFVFSVNFFPFVSEVCNIYHLRYLCWIVDSPVMELYTSAIKNEWNRVFLFDKELYREIHPLNPECVFYLPLGARVEPKEELFQKTDQATKLKFSHDLAFVGSLYTEKCPYDKLSKQAPRQLTGYLDAIMKAQELVYGYYFIEDLLTDQVVEGFKENFPTFYQQPGDTFLTDRITLSQLYIGNKISAMERVDTFQLLSEHFDTSIYTASDTSFAPKLHNRGLAKTLTEMPIIFHESKINLNITSKAIRSGLPLRIFDILSAGGFVLSNFQPEIPELLEIGADLAVYSSREELLELVDYYLRHDDERRMIAEHGYETLKRNYTFENQLGKLMLMAYGQEK